MDHWLLFRNSVVFLGTRWRRQNGQQNNAYHAAKDSSHANYNSRKNGGNPIVFIQVF